jgi:acetylornithine deacetylase/succinyl-diaminopimelate desuccinylase-like protein
MSDKLQSVLETIDSNRAQSLAALKELLAIPSVSTKPEHKPDMQRCAEWLSAKLKAAKLDVRIMPTGGGKGHPIIVAKNAHKPNRPTILFYGHYDVQPPEPLELWKTPAFEPTVRKDDNGFEAIYARGAVDDKGQVWCHCEAIAAWQNAGGLPVNLTALIEGEEEIGSDHLEAFLNEQKDLLKADLCLISDTGLFSRDVPAITYSLRGLVYEEVFLTGPSHDLHSGGYGGAVPNPANVLCELIGSLHDKDGRVNIPGFYDDVTPLKAEEKQMWAKLPFDEQQFMRDLALASLNGEIGFSTLERLWARPTLDVNGITAGYQGHGAKTVIGAKASAKVSMRLVPNQDAKKTQEQFRSALRERCPKNVKIEFINHGLSPAAVVPIDNLATKLAGEALKIGFGKDAAFIRTGGSIPVVGLIGKILGISSILVGFGLDDDRVHSPNEKFDLDCFRKGTRTAAALYDRLAGLQK